MNSFERFRQAAADFAVAALFIFGFVEPRTSDDQERMRKSEQAVFGSLAKLTELVVLAAVKIVVLTLALSFFR
jgi:hypothetical protein